MPQAKHVIMCKPGIENDTLSFHVLDTAQDF